MKFGINFFPSFRPSDSSTADYYQQCITLAECADRLGFHSVKTVERTVGRDARLPAADCTTCGAALVISTSATAAGIWAICVTDDDARRGIARAGMACTITGSKASTVATCGSSVATTRTELRDWRRAGRVDVIEYTSDGPSGTAVVS